MLHSPVKYAAKSDSRNCKCGGIVMRPRRRVAGSLPEPVVCDQDEDDRRRRSTTSQRKGCSGQGRTQAKMQLIEGLSGSRLTTYDTSLSLSLEWPTRQDDWSRPASSRQATPSKQASSRSQTVCQRVMPADPTSTATPRM